MKIILILPFLFLALSACSTIEFKPEFKTDEDERHYKARHDTVNMSEYDRQRYYDQHQLKMPKNANPKHENK